MLTVNDVVKDYDAVMTSVDHLRGVFGPESTWPAADLTLEQDLIDLGWHQKEFQIRRSFAYTVMSPDESVCLGCCYIYPSDKGGFAAKAFWWVRSSALAEGLDDRLGAAFRAWLRDRWPFKRVAFPGRDIAWNAWQKLV